MTARALRRPLPLAAAVIIAVATPLILVRPALAVPGTITTIDQISCSQGNPTAPFLTRVSYRVRNGDSSHTATTALNELIVNGAVKSSTTVKPNNLTRSIQIEETQAGPVTFAIRVSVTWEDSSSTVENAGPVTLNQCSNPSQATTSTTSTTVGGTTTSTTSGGTTSSSQTTTSTTRAGTTSSSSQTTTSTTAGTTISTTGEETTTTGDEDTTTTFGDDTTTTADVGGDPGDPGGNGGGGDLGAPDPSEPAGGRLPFTGANAVPLLVAALLAIGLGAGIVATTRRRGASPGQAGDERPLTAR